MRYSSGILLTTGDRWLVAERSPFVDDPLVWSVPGGGVPVDALGLLPRLPSACREFYEEMGARLPVPFYFRGCVERQDRRHHFTTYVFHVAPDARGMGFCPNEETGAYGWMRLSDLHRLPLHKGFKDVLPDLVSLALFPPSVPQRDTSEVVALVMGVAGGRPVSVQRQRQLEASLMRDLAAGRGPR